MDELQAKPLLRRFLTLQGTNQLLSELRQILLIHLRSADTGESADGQVIYGQHGPFPAHLPLIVGLSFLFDVRVQFWDV